MKQVAPQIGNVLLVACALLTLEGCASTNFINWKKNTVLTASLKNPAVDIVCVWQAAEGTGLDGVPTRGFAGQVMFFTRHDASPAAINGDVRVYVFDDQGTADEQSKPVHQFDFEGEAWNAHLRMTNLGPSYQLFIPYTREGHHLANCSLRVRFKPAEGPVVYSQTATVTLPGSAKQENAPIAGQIPKPVPPASSLSVESAGQITNQGIVRTSGTVRAGRRNRVAGRPIGTLPPDTNPGMYNDQIQLTSAQFGEVVPTGTNNSPTNAKRLAEVEQALQRFIEMRASDTRAAPDVTNQLPTVIDTPPREFRTAARAMPLERAPAVDEREDHRRYKLSPPID